MLTFVTKFQFRAAVFAIAAFMLAAAPAARAADASCDTLAASKYDDTKPAGVAGVDSEEIDIAAALPACRAAHEANKDDPRITYQLARVLITDGQMEEAIALLRQAATAGNVTALVDLGANIEDERPGEAFEAYQKAANLGHVLGQYNLGVAYMNGTGTPADGKAAIEWFTKALEKGDSWSANNLGVILDEGELVPADKPGAAKYYRIAADMGVVDSMINLAIMLEAGDGIDEDKAAAAELYAKAAAEGDEDGIAGVERLKEK